jgi:hypothetical protein
VAPALETEHRERLPGSVKPRAAETAEQLLSAVRG